MSVTAPAPSKAPTGRDEDMWHLTLDGSRFAMCGIDLGRGSGNSQPYDGREDCIVCADLAKRFIDGTWTP